MNFLAHAFLSFGDPEVLAGNMLSDFIKGKQKFNYPPIVQKGIHIHRKIDAFTDTHNATQQAKLFFKDRYGLYAAPLCDVIFDHFLANDILIFPGGEADLARFTSHIYTQLETSAALFPPTFASVFQHMRLQNWLYQYRFTRGIERSLAGLSRRASKMGETDTAMKILDTHYHELRNCYSDLFPALVSFTRTIFVEIMSAENNNRPKLI